LKLFEKYTDVGGKSHRSTSSNNQPFPQQRASLMDKHVADPSPQTSAEDLSFTRPDHDNRVQYWYLDKLNWTTKEHSAEMLKNAIYI
jgi:hypothetical protein